MKSTYQLIGVSWDHQPCESLPEHPARLSLEVSELGSPECLFDVEGIRRYVRVSDLLACDDIAGLDAIADMARGCFQLDILLDYVPSSGRVSYRFFERRCGQAISRMRAALPGTSIRIATAD